MRMPLTFPSFWCIIILQAGNALYTRANEFTFKRYVLPSSTRALAGIAGAFLRYGVQNMDIFVYSDESGVFDKVHNDIFVYGGIILLGQDSLQDRIRMYRSAESAMRERLSLSRDAELKASSLDNSDKMKLYRSLNRVLKFGVVIDQKRLNSRIFDDPKSKQRYLDFAYKIGIKRALSSLMCSGDFRADDVGNMFFFVDEHTTATNGRYELSEALEQEFKIGTINFEYNRFFEPLFPGMGGIKLKLCDSAANPLVRAADIVANHIYYLAVNGKPLQEPQRNLHIITLP